MDNLAPKDNEKEEVQHNESIPPSKDNENDEAQLSDSTQPSESIEKKNEAGSGERKELETPFIPRTMFEKDENYFYSLQKRIRLSVQKEYDDLLKSTEFIRNKFLVNMPPDFFYFWEFLNKLKPDATGDNILIYMKDTFQLQLVGPFEYVAGRFHGAKMFEPGDYLRHWRFFYDPPEFQTIIVRNQTSIHYGYWRDDPKEAESLLIARNDAAKSCTFDLVAGNLFEAFLHYLQNDFQKTPFNGNLVKETIKSLNKYVAEHDLKLNDLKELQKKRNTKVVAKTFHRAGIVVPYDTKTQLGYRSLSVTENELKKIIQLLDAANKTVETKELAMEKLQPIATAANIALDECDFGTALEFGIDLFCSGHTELHGLLQSLLIPTYNLLKRPQFLAILKAHIEKRNKGHDLSIL